VTVKTSTLKYREVAKALRQQIAAGEWPSGQRLPGEMLLAQRFGVAHMTMRQAINSLVEDKVLHRVPAKGTFVLDAEPDVDALTTRHPLVLLFPANAERLDPYYFPELLSGFQEAMALRGHKYSIIGYDSADRPGLLDPDSAVACLLIEPSHLELAEKLRDQRYNVLAINRYSGRRSIPSVYIDDALGVEHAVDHLVSLGHQSIGFIRGYAGNIDARERLRGFRTAIRRHGLTNTPEVGKGFREFYGYEATNALLESANPPTAIICASDLSAIGAIRAVREHGLNVPADFSVFGFGDFSVADYVMPRLTTIRQSRTTLGAAAAEALIDLANEERTEGIAIVPEIILRESVGPAPLK